MKIKKALIIAAGNGSRLKMGRGDTPKPLRKVAGLPLIKRVVLLARKAGITEFVIVVGYQKDKIIKALTEEDLGVKVEFVENRDWRLSNGLSVLAAKKIIRENFILLMSDHIFDPETLSRLAQTPLQVNKTILAVDSKLDSIFDKDDATKVKILNDKLSSIGKSLTQYNAVDTGMFLATPELFDVLDSLYQKRRDVSLSDGIALMSERGQVGTFDIGNAFWQDIDTPASLKYAEDYLFDSCRKWTDGFISRHLNRKISLAVTRLLVKTNLEANHVTGLTTLVGALSAVFVSRGDYLNVLLGAFLFQMASILDGCDGEMSKLKWTQSKFGQWLDTISDNITYVFFVVGVLIGVSKTGAHHTAVTAPLLLFGLAMSLLLAFVYLIRHTNSGSLLVFQRQYRESAPEGPLGHFLKFTYFMIKRDFFAFFFFVVAIMDGLEFIYWSCLIGTNIAWIVLLNLKPGIFRAPMASQEKSSENLQL